MLLLLLLLPLLLKLESPSALPPPPDADEIEEAARLAAAAAATDDKAEAAPTEEEEDDDEDAEEEALAAPSSTFLHRDAKLRLQTVSPRLYTAGLMFTNMRTLALPPSESCRRNVSFEFRNGMCVAFLLPSALITSPSAERDLLMFCASFSLSPVASVFESRSEPAKSIRCSFPTLLVPSMRFFPLTANVKMECDREECSFMSCEPVCVEGGGLITFQLYTCSRGRKKKKNRKTYQLRDWPALASLAQIL